MTFEQWLETRPYAGLLSEGTVNLMRQAWEAAQSQPIEPIVVKSLSGLRGDIRD